MTLKGNLKIIIFSVTALTIYLCIFIYGFAYLDAVWATKDAYWKLENELKQTVALTHKNEKYLENMNLEILKIMPSCFAHESSKIDRRKF